MSRRGLSKTLRFEVFKRDSFTCQYCGQKAPDVVLEADHIKPVSKGGTDDIFNLVTSCKACNAGKSDKQLSDHSIVEKQRNQLAELQERKEQREMMFEWQKGLTDINATVIEKLSEYWSELVPFYQLNEAGKRELKKRLNKFGLEELMQAMRAASEQYLEYENDKPTPDSVDKAWEYVSRICSVSKAEKEKPYLRELFYIRGILRNRLSYVNEQVALQLMEQAYLSNVSMESLREYSKVAQSWTVWRNGIE